MQIHPCCRIEKDNIQKLILFLCASTEQSKRKLRKQFQLGMVYACDADTRVAEAVGLRI
jgi:hypothetical protein